MIKIAKAIIALGILTTILQAQMQIDARGLGLCGTYTAASRGYASVGINPANLGFDSGNRFEMNLVSANVRDRKSVV